MDLFTLDSTFQRDKVIDEYISLIWTERFIKNGDMNLVLPSTPERRAALAEGVFVGLLDSDVPMQIETQSTEDGLITCVGKTLDTFFNQREIWITVDPAIDTWDLRGKPGELLGYIVQEMLVSGLYVNNEALGIGGDLNAIPYLVVGDIDTTGDEISVKIPIGPVYDAIFPIAETYNIGMKVFLSRSDAFGYELTFTSYKGLDRTSDQLENNLVQFSSQLDSLSNVKELRSLAEYKTVAYVFPPDWSSSTPPVVEYAPGADPAATGFDRRILVTRATDISNDQVAPAVPGVTLLSLMTQKAKDALANNNFTKIVDGEVVPQSQYKYGTDYMLGDLIELKGQDGLPQKAQITEFIRSKDATGERAYPTVSVI
jgi:Siphovirus ReqiPepy6 Gp37-like protein